MILIHLDQIIGYEWAIAHTQLAYDSRPALDVPGSDLTRADPEACWQLAKKLVVRGDEHAKFMRAVTVYLTIAAPRYWWSEFDTYKVGTVALSQSTMHTLTKRCLTKRDFAGYADEPLLDLLNKMVQLGDWYALKQNLPEGFLQARGVCTNLQTLRRMYQQRKEHRLPEWRQFTQWIASLPVYGRLITLSRETTNAPDHHEAYA